MHSIAARPARFDGYRDRLLPSLPLSLEPHRVLTCRHRRYKQIRRLVSLAPGLSILDPVVILDGHRERLNQAGRFIDQVALDIQPAVVYVPRAAILMFLPPSIWNGSVKTT